MSSEVSTVLRGQHVLHGVLGEVYDELGGKELVKEWAKENPGGFIKMIMACTPSMTPMNHIQGDVHLHVHPALAPTELDHSTIDITPDE